LAQTYFALNRWEDALQTYRRRADLGGWAEEVYYSLYRIGQCQHFLGLDYRETAASFFRAHLERPHRLEALVSLCQILREQQLWQMAYDLSVARRHIPEDELFVDATLTWRILEEHGIASYYLGKLAEAKACFKEVLDGFRLGEPDLQRM